MIISLVAMPVEIIKAIVYYSKAKKLDNDIRKKNIQTYIIFYLSYKYCFFMCRKYQKNIIKIYNNKKI